MKSDIKYVFQRTEKKYLLTEKQYNLLLEKTGKIDKIEKNLYTPLFCQMLLFKGNREN